MPADKTHRASLRKRTSNRVGRNTAKTLVRHAQVSLASGDVPQGEEAVARANSALAKAGQKGSIHPNNAARRKSRLMRKLNQTRQGTSS